MPFERQGAGREPEPERAEPVELRGAPVTRVLALQPAAGNRAVTQLIAGAAIRRQACRTPRRLRPPRPLLRQPGPGQRAEPADARRAPDRVDSAAGCRAGDDPGLQPGAQATVALGPSGVPVDHADRARALSAIRHALMEGLSRNLATARAAGEPEAALVKIARDYLTALRGAAAADRFEHPDQAVRDAVSGALGLEEVDRAVAEAGAHDQAGPDPTNPARNLPNAEARARAGGRLPGDADWCGAFAQSMQRQSGANPDLAQFMHGTEGIISLLNYRAHHWIQVGGAWDTGRALPRHRCATRAGSGARSTRRPRSTTRATSTCAPATWCCSTSRAARARITSPWSALRPCHGIPSPSAATRVAAPG